MNVQFLLPRVLLCSLSSPQSHFSLLSRMWNRSPGTTDSRIIQIPTRPIVLSILHLRFWMAAESWLIYLPCPITLEENTKHLKQKEIPLKKKLIVKTTESNGYNFPPFLDADIHFQCPSLIDVNLFEKISVLSSPIILAVPIHISLECFDSSSFIIKHKRIFIFSSI